MSLCQSCEKDIKEEEEAAGKSFVCDNCDSAFHNKCAGVKRAEVNARKDSKVLRILCPFCAQTNDEALVKKVNLLTKIAHKTDLSCQKQNASIDSNNTLLGALSRNVLELVEKVEKLTMKIESLEANASTTAKVIQSSDSYAKAVSAKAVSAKPVKPAVVIKPKHKQNSKKTMKELTKSVDKNSVDVCGARNARDGGIVLQCRNANETMKVKQIVKDKLGDEYDVTLPAVKHPRLRITNVDTQIPDDSIINELKQHNENIRDFDMKLVTIIPRNYRGSMSNDVIVEVKSDVYNKLIDIGVLYLQWIECRIFEHLHVKRCFKCLGFSHIASQCSQNTQCCSKCAGNHKFDDCKSKKLCCANCKAANQRNRLNLDTRHHAFSRDCSILQRRLAVIRNKIAYNPSE